LKLVGFVIGPRTIGRPCGVGPKMWKVYVSRNRKFVWNDEVGRENEGKDDMREFGYLRERGC